ncbi:MAG: hypothetical protein ABIQ84_03395 [Usitatibacter sp.]
MKMGLKQERRQISGWIFIACGVWLVGLGIYFMAFRPGLLPEDSRYLGRSLSVIQAALPELERWLSRVFGVMGGFMAGAGALTVFVAITAVPARSRGTGATLALVGLLTVVSMSATNFAIDSDFKWLLLAPALLWLAGVACYYMER